MTGVSRSAEMARPTAARSSASSASVELMKTLRRWSGVRIATLPCWATVMPRLRGFPRSVAILSLSRRSPIAPQPCRAGATQPPRTSEHAAQQTAINWLR